MSCIGSCALGGAAAATAHEKIRVTPSLHDMPRVVKGSNVCDGVSPVVCQVDCCRRCALYSLVRRGNLNYSDLVHQAVDSQHAADSHLASAATPRGSWMHHRTQPHLQSCSAYLPTCLTSLMLTAAYCSNSAFFFALPVGVTCIRCGLCQAAV